MNCCEFFFFFVLGRQIRWFFFFFCLGCFYFCVSFLPSSPSSFLTIYDSNIDSFRSEYSSKLTRFQKCYFERSINFRGEWSFLNFRPIFAHHCRGFYAVETQPNQRIPFVTDNIYPLLWRAVIILHDIREDGPTAKLIIKAKPDLDERSVTIWKNSFLYEF